MYFSNRYMQTTQLNDEKNSKVIRINTNPLYHKKCASFHRQAQSKCKNWETYPMSYTIYSEFPVLPISIPSASEANEH